MRTLAVAIATHPLRVQWFVNNLAVSEATSTVFTVTGLALPAGTNLVYFAFVNYATLGYGDVVPVEGWRLLGPITAMNGALLFGWSTAVIFQVLHKTMMIDYDTADTE